MKIRYKKRENMVLTLVSARRLWNLVLVGLFFSWFCNGQQLQKESIVKTDYLISLPKDYKGDPSKKWPLMVYLHGGLQSPTLEGLKQDFLPYRISQGMEFPFIVVSPLCNTGLWNTGILNFLFEDVVKEFRIDRNRVFLTGHSMGGNGTWEWAFDNPHKFAAIVPVSGCSKESDRQHAWKLRDMPIWLFHGDADKVVEIDCNLDIAERLKKYGSNLRFTKYPGTGHDTWEQTYLHDELYQWLQQQNRKNNTPKSLPLKEEVLKNYYGKYVMDGDTLTISSDNGQPLVSIGKGLSRKLLAESDTIFSFAKNPFAGVSFIKKDGKVWGFKILPDKDKLVVKVK